MVYSEHEFSQTSSLSFHALLNQLYQSFTGQIEDPDQKPTVENVENKNSEVFDQLPKVFPKPVNNTYTDYESTTPMEPETTNDCTKKVL